MNNAMTNVLQMLVEHTGRENAIPASEISEVLGINEDARHPRTRALVRACVQRYSLPVVACNAGYYMASSEEDYNDYVDRLDQQISKVKERKRLISENYKLWVSRK